MSLAGEASERKEEKDEEDAEKYLEISSDSEDDEEFRDALDRQMMELEAEGREAEFSPRFRSVEEARKEIEEAGEEYRRKEEEKRRQKGNEAFDEFSDALAEGDLPQAEVKKEVAKEDDEMEARRRREENLSEEEKEELKKQAEMLKAEGNSCYLEKQNDEAVTKYSKALDLCPLVFKNERAVFFANRSAARCNMGLLEMALEDCHSALDLKPDYVKALSRRAHIYEQQDKPHEAMKDFEKVLEFDRDHKDARIAVRRLPEKIAAKDEQIKQEMFGNLRKLGDMVLNPFGLSVDNFKFEKNEETGSYSVNFKQGGT